MDQPDITNKSKRWQRIGWYSLPVCVLTLFGLFAFAFWHFKQPLGAIAEIERLGGAVVTEDGRVVDVYFVTTQITDNDLRHLKGMTTLKVLVLTESPITDDGLRHLSGLKNQPPSNVAFQLR